MLMKNKEIQALKKNELNEKLQELKANLLKYRMQNTLGQLEKTTDITNTKKTIARIKTQLTILKKAKE